MSSSTIVSIFKIYLLTLLIIGGCTKNPTLKTRNTIIERTQSTILEEFPTDSNDPLYSTFINASQTPADPRTVPQPKYLNCLPKQGSAQVQVVNDTELLMIIAPNSTIALKNQPATCMCVLFYSKNCPFSSLAAPHFNALPRAFPDIKMVAINAMTYYGFNTQNGIVGVPSILMLFNGKIMDKYNGTEYSLEQFSRFITKNTGIEPEEKSFVTSADFSGPVTSNPNIESDMMLVLAWSFIVFSAIYYFMRSKWWNWIVESVKHNWRESEAQAQHPHAD